GFHETFSPSLVSLPIYSRPNKMHLIKLRFPACCKRIGLFRVQPARASKSTSLQGVDRICYHSTD
ncbi:hypothetical protein, partial [uncultured Agathobaculum sp.]|uniref:hypothetical protein n=1 Tax=uncultured Agathobaculum sp. TaxID=2048140 RepID=UPI00296E6105